MDFIFVHGAQPQQEIAAPILPCRPFHLLAGVLARPNIWVTLQCSMCNLYSVTKSQQAIRDLVKAIRDLTGNVPPLPAVFPDKLAPIARTGADGMRELVR